MAEQQRGLILVLATLFLFWYLRQRPAIPEVEMPGRTPQFETWST